uniref:Protein RIC-3-like n=1 Tax=Seriola lalandi dorsalis TaxID=1841481 RepID=A0A3B4XGW5_SERLL
MVMSTFQKVTLATCLVLCVALLLPKLLLSRGRKDAAERPEGASPLTVSPGRQNTAPEGRGQRAASAGFSRAHNTEAIAKAKGVGTGAGTGGKSNLAGQIIPVYGFGILLYILYILFKVKSWRRNTQLMCAVKVLIPQYFGIPLKSDFQLAQLQEKLRETELVMENIVSNAHHMMADQEESLLQQLTEITRVMQEGQLVEGITPEKKAQDNWEDYPEQPHQYWQQSRCSCQHNQPHHSPQTEAEAERTEADGANLVEDIPAEDVTGGGKPEEAEDLSTDAVRESDFTAASEEDMRSGSDLGVNEGAHLHEHKEGGGKIDLGVPEEDLAGVLKELELTLKMTSMMEQEKMEDLTRPVETEPAQSQVRRRNKRRRAKKAAH